MKTSELERRQQGERLKYVRAVVLRFTQKEFADHLEIALTRYQTYEQGTRGIPNHILILFGSP